MRPRRRGFAGHLERDEFFLHAVGFLFRENGAAIEFALVERDKKSEPGLDGRGLLVQFMAVKRIANFRAQRVARAEAAGLDAERLAGGEQLVPNDAGWLRPGRRFQIRLRPCSRCARRARCDCSK